MNKIDRLVQLTQKKTRFAIGLMTGMSRDGIDLAYLKIEGEYPNWSIELIDTLFGDFSQNTKTLLQKGDDLTLVDIACLDRLIGEDLGQCVNYFLQMNKLSADAIDMIGSHGQTVVHLPPGEAMVATTLQLGAGAVIAQITGILTVSNFRLRDMVVGGQGAPLIPIVDYLLFTKPGVVRSLNNLGSISNLTVVTEERATMMAFDTGPANMPIDYFAKMIPGNHCGIDLDGKCSAQGQVIDDLLAELLALGFLSKPPPKSAGYQEFGPIVLGEILSRYPKADPKDLTRTAVEFTCESIAQAYERFVQPEYSQLSEILFTGGGAYNKTLMSRLKERLPQYSIQSLADIDKNLNDAKEAMGFGILANLTLSGLTGNIPVATGAKEGVVLGDISL